MECNAHKELMTSYLLYVKNARMAIRRFGVIAELTQCSEFFFHFHFLIKLVHYLPQAELFPFETYNMYDSSYCITI